MLPTTRTPQGAFMPVVDADVAKVVATHGPFELTETCARSTSDHVTYDEWEAAVVWAFRAEKSWKFWVADLLAFGEQQYGDMYTQAMEATNLGYQTLANMKNVARSVHSSRRR